MHARVLEAGAPVCACMKLLLMRDVGNPQLSNLKSEMAVGMPLTVCEFQILTLMKLGMIVEI